ncbi:carbohydrate binding domain-containing protein [Calothrix membranacea FACHB-236]|nr:carbohydrate binding domain-containing protein [Calothrix membranacea FACHB-236]
MRISKLPNYSSPTPQDILPIIDIDGGSEGQPKTKRVTVENLLSLVTPGTSSFEIPTTIKTTADAGDYFIGIDSTGELYKITKANLLAGLSTGGGSTGGGSVTQNLITYSQALHNAVWSNQDVTITANATTAPDSTTTASAASFNTTSGKIYRVSGQGAAVVAGQTYTHSIYAKAASGTFNFKLGRTNQATWSTAFVSNEFTATTTWQRFEFSYTVPAGETVSDFLVGDEDKTGYSLPQTGILYLWGAQINQGSTAVTYTPTTGSIVP